MGGEQPILGKGLLLSETSQSMTQAGIRRLGKGWGQVTVEKGTWPVNSHENVTCPGKIPYPETEEVTLNHGGKGGLYGERPLLNTTSCLKNEERTCTT